MRTANGAVKLVGMTSTQTAEFTPATLDDVKVGDTIMLMSGWSNATPVKVAKVTPTQVHLDAAGLRKYHKKNGRQIGSPYGSSVRVPQPGELGDREREDASKALIRRIAAIVDPQTGVERSRNHAKLIAGPIENLEQALALLADSMRDEDENEG